MKKQAKKSKVPAKKSKSASKAKSAMKISMKAKTATKAAGKKKTVKKAAAKKSAKKMTMTESRDAHHNALMSQSTDYMTEHGQMPKRRGARARAPKTIEKTAKPEAIPIRQPQLHSEN